MISTTAMGKIKIPARSIPFHNNALFSRHSGDTFFSPSRVGAKSDTMLHHPKWKTSFEDKKTATFLLSELSDFLARQSSGFPYFMRPS